MTRHETGTLAFGGKSHRIVAGIHETLFAGFKDLHRIDEGGVVRGLDAEAHREADAGRVGEVLRTRRKQPHGFHGHGRPRST